MSLLRVATPAAWIAKAREMPDLLLIDHANCEKKAASTALSLMFAYAEDLELADKLSRLAREELRHYEQVAKLFKTLQIVPQRLAPGRYAERLRRLVSKSEPQREVDLMVCGAFIEARSCERFAALGAHIGGPLGALFEGLHAGGGAPPTNLPRPCTPRRDSQWYRLGAAHRGIRAAGSRTHQQR